MAIISGVFMLAGISLTAAFQFRQQAAKRRIMMVIPIVVILAPVTLLFLGAPIPSIILGT